MTEAQALLAEYMALSKTRSAVSRMRHSASRLPPSSPPAREMTPVDALTRIAAALRKLPQDHDTIAALRHVEARLAAVR